MILTPRVICFSLRRQLYRGCVEAAAAAAAQTDPDLVVLHTPHGVLLSDAVGLYGNANARGSAEWEQHWGEFEVSRTRMRCRRRELETIQCMGLNPGSRVIAMKRNALKIIRLIFDRFCCASECARVFVCVQMCVQRCAY